MDPGVVVEGPIGEPVTKDDIRQELGETRRFQLLRKDVRKAAESIGFTEGCPGCRAVQGGYVSRPMHTDTCRTRMETEISKTARGAARMEDYNRRLADEVEARVRRENKIAKTESALSPEKENTTAATTPFNQPASQPEVPDHPITHGATSSSDHQSMIVNPPSVQSSSPNVVGNSMSSGMKRKPDGDGNSNACRTRQEPARGEKRNSN